MKSKVYEFIKNRIEFLLVNEKLLLVWGIFMNNKKKLIGIILCMILILFLLIFLYFYNVNMTKNNKVSIKILNDNVISNINNSNFSSNNVSNYSSNSNIINSNSDKTITSISSNKVSSSTINKTISGNSTSNRTIISNSNVNTKPLTIKQRVDKKLKEMTLDEKIGQLLIISFNGTSRRANL